jgi:hypothetical protein
MSRIYLYLDSILLTLWVGGLWTVGFLVAPTLFALMPEKALAGSVAGSLFSGMSMIGLVCGSLLLVSKAVRRACEAEKWSSIVIVAMLVIIVIGEFVLSPMLSELREAGASSGSEFARLHGISSVLYVLNCLLGLVLVVLKSR